MDSDTARDRAADALVGLQNQLTDIAAMQKKREALKVNAQAADGAVEVTVNAQGQLVNIVIDKSYLDNHDFDKLGAHIIEAAQSAVRNAGQRVAEMLGPINERHKSLPRLSDIAEGIPDPSDLMPPGFIPAPPQKGSIGSSVGRVYDDGADGGAEFPTVRRRIGG